MGKMEHVIQMFIDEGRIATALSEAARWGEIKIARKLLDEGVAIDSRDENGGTALMNAASGGKTKIVEMLLKRGADVNAVHETKGYTPLIWCLAAWHREKVYLDIVSRLIDAGADVTIRGTDGMTALDHAKTRDSEKLIALLTDAKSE